MRLLDAKTLRLETFPDETRRPPYAVLSHTWGDAEITYQDVTSLAPLQLEAMPEFAKIKYTCQQALDDNLTHVWIDTCCIDKSSSAELSEAINSMFVWYRRSNVCYAFLEDVEGGMSHLHRSETEVHSGVADLDTASFSADTAAFAASRWFKRGWTLQELLAPPRVVIFGRSWTQLGPLSSFVQLVSHITKIPMGVLKKDVDPSTASVAKRMSWASNRETSRKEDHAYCLIGLFGIKMPLVYGEGRVRAFRRLQEEIAETSSDDSLFAHANTDRASVFAQRPCDFRACGFICQGPQESMRCAYTVTKHGLELSAKLVTDPSVQRDENVLAILKCFDERYPRDYVALRLIPLESSHPDQCSIFGLAALVHISLDISCVAPARRITIQTRHEEYPEAERIYLNFDDTRQSRHAQEVWSAKVRGVFPMAHWDLVTMSCSESGLDSDGGCSSVDDPGTWNKSAFDLDILRTSRNKGDQQLLVKSWSISVVFHFIKLANGTAVTAVHAAKHTGLQLQQFCEKAKLGHYDGWVPFSLLSLDDSSHLSIAAHVECRDARYFLTVTLFERRSIWRMCGDLALRRLAALKDWMLLSQTGNHAVEVKERLGHYEEQQSPKVSSDRPYDRTYRFEQRRADLRRRTPGATLTDK